MENTDSTEFSKRIPAISTNPAINPQEAAIAIEFVRRNVDSIVEDFVPGDRNNLGQQILTMWLITDKKRIKSITHLATHHRYFRENKIDPTFAKRIIADTAEELHAQKLMHDEGMSEEAARLKAKEFRKQRTSLVHEKLSEKLGSRHFSEKGKLQASAWPNDQTEKLLDALVDPNYRWQTGKYQGTPNWRAIAKDIGVSVKKAKDHYHYLKKNIEAGITGPEITEYAQKVGMYTSKETIDWATIIPDVQKLLVTDQGSFVWKEGANKDKPKWIEIMKQLESENKLPFSVDWDNPVKIRKYSSELSNAFKRYS